MNDSALVSIQTQPSPTPPPPTFCYWNVKP